MCRGCRVHRSLLVVFLVLAGTLVVGVSPARAQTPGLVAAWGFNEGSGTTVADSSGNNNTGTISGTNAMVTVPSSTSLRLTTGMTLEAWVYPTAAPSDWRAVIDKNVDVYYLMASSDRGNVPAVGGTFGTVNQNTFAPSTL